MRPRISVCDKNTQKRVFSTSVGEGEVRGVSGGWGGDDEGVGRTQLTFAMFWIIAMIMYRVFLKKVFHKREEKMKD